MPEENKESLTLSDKEAQIIFTIYPWLSGLLWLIFVGRSFFYLLHLTGSARELFQHSIAIDTAITFGLALPPLALFLLREYFLPRKVQGGRTLKELWEAFTLAKEQPEAPAVEDRWGKKQNELWIFVGGIIYVALVIAFSIYGLK